MAQGENYRVYKEWKIEGSLDIESGGGLTVKSGGELDIAGTFSKNSVDLTEQLTFVKYARVTIAEVNAGEELLPAIASKAYRITGLLIRAVGGAAGAVTSVDIQDGASSPVVVAVFAQAQLTEDTILTENTTGATMGAGFLVGTTAAKAVDIIKNGSDVTTATHFDVVIEYQIIAG